MCILFYVSIYGKYVYLYPEWGHVQVTVGQLSKQVTRNGGHWAEIQTGTTTEYKMRRKWFETSVRLLRDKVEIWLKSNTQIQEEPGVLNYSAFFSIVSGVFCGVWYAMNGRWMSDNSLAEADTLHLNVSK